MRNIPVFTTEYGVGSLILREIPYRQEAYIRIQDTKEPEAFLEECVDFCKAAGAERIYGTGHPCCESYPLHTAVLQMQGDVTGLGDTDAVVFPVVEKNLSRFREIYNEKMSRVPNASFLTEADAREILKEGSGYFVHREGELLGIGVVKEPRLLALAACRKGAGETVVKALCHTFADRQVLLEVASANGKACMLYERLGFVPTAELSRWYRIF